MIFKYNYYLHYFFLSTHFQYFASELPSAFLSQSAIVVAHRHIFPMLVMLDFRFFIVSLQSECSIGCTVVWGTIIKTSKSPNRKTLKPQKYTPMRITKTTPEGEILEVAITDGAHTEMTYVIEWDLKKEERDSYLKTIEKAEQRAQKLGKDFKALNPALIVGLDADVCWNLLCLLAMKTLRNTRGKNPVLTDYITSSLNNAGFNHYLDAETKKEIAINLYFMLGRIENHLEVCRELGLNEMGTGVYEALRCGYDDALVMDAVRAAREFMEFYGQHPYPAPGLSKDEEEELAGAYEEKILELLHKYNVMEFTPEDEDEVADFTTVSYILFDIIGFPYDEVTKRDSIVDDSEGGDNN